MDGSPVVDKAKSQHLSNARDVKNCKQLCDLPHAILLHILAFLPTEDAVRTSVLSRRWEYLWTSIPSLVFGEEYEGDHRRRKIFRNFGREHSFYLTCKVDREEYLDGNESRVNLWITAAICCNVEDLHLHLKIGHEMKHDLKLPSLVCLTNLKVLFLMEVRFGDDNSVEKLLSCPSLEKLSLDIKIHGAFIKSFDYFGELLYDYDILSSPSLVEALILCYHDEIEEHFPEGPYHLHKLLKAVSNVKELFFSIESFELLSRCPILKSIEFTGSILVVSKKDDWILDPVPPCFTSSLKEITIDGFQGTSWELLAVRILLRTAVLVEICINCSGHCPENFSGKL
ncbi:hypothetical protein BT93_E2563 [Corymbia citriodora subsp. variegata]|nr:hypothetical protein BT93_E2563 [Corymbia citriodora subsp. variegata]